MRVHALTDDIAASLALFRLGAKWRPRHTVLGTFFVLVFRGHDLATVSNFDDDRYYTVVLFDVPAPRAFCHCPSMTIAQRRGYDAIEAGIRAGDLSLTGPVPVLYNAPVS